MGEGYTCAHCGKGGLSMQCHYGKPKDVWEFSCKEGKENMARSEKGLPDKWDYGKKIERVCSECGQNVIKS